ncbi:MAG: carboxypeptidase regulatory-like domain-containing protein [Desulfobulbaceae bacterium]|nr:carboxypeptidase regulatory-like domain-containing protein [Desulfobulbaceae bacterium]
MKSWSDWEIIRRQVAIAGHIVDKRNTPVAGVHVNITSSTENASRIKSTASALRAGGANLDEHIDHTLSRWDGLYYFMDLPDGHYTISIHREGKVTEKDQKVSVARDKKNNLTVSQADFTLIK